MTYRNASLFFSAFLTVAAAFGPSTAEAGRAHVILDANTGQILEAENADAINYPASLTKMMTLYLTFEALHQKRFGWDDRLVMSENAESKEPYKFAVGAGNKITVREAVMGMIVLSTNDAAVAVAETLAGSEQAFGQMMTAKARALGMTSTVFTNPAGLPDPNQVTTAADMARLGLALMRDYPEEYKLFATTCLTFRSMKFRGHNNLLSTYPGADGIKTGYTKASGYNLVSSASNGSRRVVGVVLGGDSAAERDGQMAALFDKYLGAQYAK